MINIDDYFGGLTREEYKRRSEEHFKYLEHLSRVDYNKGYYLIEKFKENLFATEFVSDEEAEMLYHTIIYWKDKADMYDDSYN